MLVVLLVAGLVAQAALAATHLDLELDLELPVAAAAGAEAPGGDAHEGHEAGSCLLCRAAPALDHGLHAAPLQTLRASEGIHRVDRPLAPLHSAALLSRPSTRAPPSPSR